MSEAAVQAMRRALALVWGQSLSQVTDTEARWAIGVVARDTDTMTVQELPFYRVIAKLERDGDEHGAAADLRAIARPTSTRNAVE